MIKFLATSTILAFCLAGCASAPPLTSEIKEGQWRGKALIKDKELNKSYLVHLNMNAVRDASARLDVTSTLGTGVASLVVTPEELKYVLFEQKRFYSGPPKPSAMKPILSMPFDPRLLHNLLFGELITDAGWSCRTLDSPARDACTESATQTEVSWTKDSSSERRVITIEHPRASIKINVQSFRPKVEERKNLFVLEAPEGYQKTRVSK